MDHSRRRRKWTSGDLRNEMPLHVSATREEVPPQYEHYLQLLQERNKLMKKLRQKNKREIDLEKKEKGFTLYLNSSYQENKSSKSNKPHRAKTAGAAEILTGRYHEDFEQVSSDDDIAGVVHSMSSLDVDDNSDEDHGQNVNSSTSSLNTPRKVSYLKRVAAAKREEVESENRVTLKVEDIKKLRESLQMDKRIRQSIAMDVDSVKEFNEGKESLSDCPHPGRPKSCMNEQTIASMKKDIDENPHISVEELSGTNGLSCGTVHTIITEHLCMKKVHAQWIPHLLTVDQNREKVHCATELLNMFKPHGPKRLSDTVTGDETWFPFFIIPPKCLNHMLVDGQGDRPFV
ncbi:transposase [Elysia marginata]|uniref:Transposase n=1 Tax=Elysia marginata TaxID=1093978 RepID=A0AAV4GH03_9GAST|nr:transposase [Elysia marginata]